jgi:acyl-CoA synthetase (AMP-forming)/AMP-acid ligase II
MLGLMQDWPLTINRFLDHAEQWHGRREVASRRDDGSIGRKTYTEIHRSAKQLSNALLAYGIGGGDRVATLAMNGTEHIEAWYAIAGIGAICHTINPRLGAEQIGYIIRHAGDRMIFADGAFADLLAQVLPFCPDVERVVFLSRPARADDIAAAHSMLQEFTSGHSGDCPWGQFDENTAAGLCYTSGTTGAPKGVLYSHRSNALHTLITLQADVFGISAHDTIMPIVPMYHANAWGLVFSGPAAGAKLVMPGAMLDGRSLYELIDGEAVTMAAGVPTVWFSLLQFVSDAGVRLPTLKRVLVGGAACPERLIRDFDALGVTAIPAWGMTEMSPIGVIGKLTAEIASMPEPEQMRWRIKQGRVPCGVELKLVDAGGKPVPHDGQTAGHLRVRGPAVASGYFGDAGAVLDADGFFDTGDISTIDPQGFMQITDRAKDIIKSGGEWVSSQSIENAALLHPKVAAASVIGIPHSQWGERPLLLVVLKTGAAAEADELLVFLRERLVKWHVPERVNFVEEFPLGATGKIDKRRLRELHAAGMLGP